MEEDETPIRINLANDEGKPLVASLYYLQFYSGLVRSLPATDQWDLSGLMVDGQPVSRATVVSWLNLVYRAAADEEYEQQPKHVLGFGTTVQALYRLLMFADAVSSTRPILKAAVADLRDMVMEVAVPHDMVYTVLGEENVVPLLLDGRAYIFGKKHMPASFQLSNYPAGGTPLPEIWFDDEAEFFDPPFFVNAVAEQTEQLLFMAHKLQLQPLIQLLNEFITANACTAYGMLCTVMDAIVSDRVLVAAGEASSSKQAFVQRMLNMPIQIASQGGLLSLDSVPDEQQPLQFQAKLERDALGSRRGESVVCKLAVSGEGIQLTIGGMGPLFFEMRAVQAPEELRSRWEQDD